MIFSGEIADQRRAICADVSTFRSFALTVRRRRDAVLHDEAEGAAGGLQYLLLGAAIQETVDFLLHNVDELLGRCRLNVDRGIGQRGVGQHAHALARRHGRVNRD